MLIISNPIKMLNLCKTKATEHKSKVQALSFNLREARFITLTGYSPPVREAKAGTEAETMECWLLTCCSISQSGYLYTVQVHLPRMTPLSELALIRQIAMTTSQSNVGNSSSQMTLVWVEFTKVSSRLHSKKKP